MNFFDPSEILESKKSMDHYKEWAGEISSSYLNNGTPPTETLTKIAQVEELKPHQIQMLAGEANKMIHTHKYASMKEKYFAADFPLADAKTVIENLQHDTVKVASAFIDPKNPDEELTPEQMFGVTLPEMDKTASVKHSMKVAFEKIASLQEKLASQIIVTMSKLQENEHSFIKQARQYALNDSSSNERMRTLNGLNHFVKKAKCEKTGRRLLAKLAHVLGREGLLEPMQAKRAFEFFTKEADEKAPQELISESLNCQVINGNHPLYITLKTIQDNEAELLRWNRESSIVDDKARIIRQKIRAL